MFASYALSIVCYSGITFRILHYMSFLVFSSVAAAVTDIQRQAGLQSSGSVICPKQQLALVASRGEVRAPSPPRYRRGNHKWRHSRARRRRRPTHLREGDAMEGERALARWSIAHVRPSVDDGRVCTFWTVPDPAPDPAPTGKQVRESCTDQVAMKN